MRVLELFCGTKSFSKRIEPYADEIVTLDFEADFEPTICCDILKWDYTTFPQGYFDFIWASPNCKQWSVCNTIPPSERTLEIENSRLVVLKTLEIICYFNPCYYVIENPQTGYLKNMPMMKDIPYVDLDYCKYGYSYRKRTRFWTNIEWTPKPFCSKGGGYCIPRQKMIEERGKNLHPYGFGRPTQWYKDMDIVKVACYKQRISIPPKVIDDLLSCIL